MRSFKTVSKKSYDSEKKRKSQKNVKFHEFFLAKNNEE